METPKYFINSAVPWEHWYSTRVFSNNNVKARTTYSIVTFDHQQVEAHYPGLTEICKTLSDMGCDDVFVTSVLKACIPCADGMNLAQFIVQSPFWSKVKVAVTIGLTGDEFAASLLNTEPMPDLAPLPDSLDPPV